MAYTPKLNNMFRSFGSDQTNNIANDGLQFIDFYHVPTGYSTKFKAMITDFSDQYTSNWNAEDVYGRMDPIATFQKTGRVINFSFDVVAGNQFEAEENLTRIQALIQMLYPVYSGNTMKNSPMMEIKFGNLIQNTVDGRGLLGFLGGIDYSPNVDVGSYVLYTGEEPVRGYGHFAKVANLSCQFTVLHENRLGWNKNKARNDKFPYGGKQFYDDKPLAAIKQDLKAAGLTPDEINLLEEQGALQAETGHDLSGNPKPKRTGEGTASATKPKKAAGKNKKKKPVNAKGSARKKNVLRGVQGDAMETIKADTLTSSEILDIYPKSPTKKGQDTRKAGEPGYKEKEKIGL